MKWFLIYLIHVVRRVLKPPYSMFDCNPNSKFNDSCKPEECSSGQPKYCLKKHVKINPYFVFGAFFGLWFALPLKTPA